MRINVQVFVADDAEDIHIVLISSRGLVHQNVLGVENVEGLGFGSGRLVFRGFRFRVLVASLRGFRLWVQCFRCRDVGLECGFDGEGSVFECLRVRI